MATGLKTGGRHAGTPNLLSEMAVKAVLARTGYNPALGTVLIASNEVRCTVCRGGGKTRYKLSDDVAGRRCSCMDEDPEQPDQANANCWKCDGSGQQLAEERTCQSCWGQLWEPMKPEVMLKANDMLLKRLDPELKQVDHVSSDGSRNTWVLVRAEHAPNVIETSGTASARLMSPEGQNGD